MILGLLLWGMLLTPWCGSWWLPHVRPPRRRQLAIAFATIPLGVLALLALGKSQQLSAWSVFHGPVWGLQITDFAWPLLLVAALLPWCLLIATPTRDEEGSEAAMILRCGSLAQALTLLALGSWGWIAVWALTTLVYLLPRLSVTAQRQAGEADILARGAVQARLHLGAAGAALLPLLLPLDLPNWLGGPVALLVVLAVTGRGQLLPFQVGYAAWFEASSLTRVAASLALTPAPWLLLACRGRLAAAPWAADALFWLSLGTALYAAILAHGETQARRILAWILLSTSSLVVTGLASGETASHLGGLLWWVGTTAAGGGLVIVLRAVEARRGRQLLDRNHGGYERMPVLAGSFLVLGLAMIGFPGTLCMVGHELLVDGLAAKSIPLAILLMAFGALNSIALLRAYFRLFCGRRPEPGSGQACRPRERFALVVLILFLLGGGLRPQPMLDSLQNGWRQSNAADENALLQDAHQRR